MKKSVCLLFSFLLVFFAASCSPEQTSSQRDSIDLEYFVSLGKIPEVPYALGDSISKIKDELSAQAEESGSHSVYNFMEGKTDVLIDSGTALYYYKKEKEEKGLSYIVTFEKAFGLELGSLTIEVKDALKEYSYTEPTPTEDDVFFLNSAEGLSVMKYQIEKRVVLFVFQDNALLATALYDTETWR